MQRLRRRSEARVTDPRIRLLYTRAELIGMGRCADCGWHEPTQGHHNECPTRDKSEGRAV